MDLMLILKGFIVGIGKIIPGVSGSMLAITLGLYEKVIDAVTNFFGNVRSNIKLLANFGLGVFLAIIFFSKLILFLLNNYYSETMYLFLGLIVGTLIPFTKKLKTNKKNILIFVVFLSLMFVLFRCDVSSSFVFKPSLFNYLYVSFLGMIDAFTSIVPGISGTAIYMMLGVYEFVLEILSNPFSINFIIYGFGLILGIIIICYVMNYLFKTKKSETMSAIFAFMVASIILLVGTIINEFNIFLGIVFGTGILIGYLFDK